jgi:cell division protein FtsL
MSTIAQAPASARRTDGTAARAGTVRSRAPFAGGVLWILLIGVMLAGIVALNVVVLQLNMEFDGLSRERAQLRADNALLRSRLSSASSHLRIEDAARAKLGLQEADALTTTYVRLGAK